MVAVVNCMRIYEWVLNSCDRHHENVMSYLTSSFLFCHLISTISVPISSLYFSLFIVCHLVCWYCSRFWIRQGTLEVTCEQWCGLRLKTNASYEDKPTNAYKHIRISYIILFSKLPTHTCFGGSCHTKYILQKAMLKCKMWSKWFKKC